MSPGWSTTTGLVVDGAMRLQADERAFVATEDHYSFFPCYSRCPPCGGSVFPAPAIPSFPDWAVSRSTRVVWRPETPADRSTATHAASSIDVATDGPLASSFLLATLHPLSPVGDEINPHLILRALSTPFL